MKRFLLFFCAVLICGVAFARTVRWHVGDTVIETTTCELGTSITPPTAPTKYGYTFREWQQYIPIEYLENTGTQYIDTGILPSTGIKIKTQASTTKPDGDNYIIGDSTYVSVLSFFNNHVGWHMCGDGRLDSQQTVQQGVVYTIEAYNGTLKINNFEYNCTLRSSISATKNMNVFHLNTYRPQSTLKLYYLKIYDNNTLVRDFIPVLDKNGTPCLYDKVTNQFFYNQGTGQFIAGPVI